jgi:hypothetical protein
LNDLTAFLEARTLQDPSLSGPNLANKIATEFGVNVFRTTINLIRKGLRFKYRPVRHNQALTERHKAARAAFYRKMLDMARSLLKIHFYGVRHRVHRYLGNPYNLARVLDQERRGLSVP